MLSELSYESSREQVVLPYYMISWQYMTNCDLSSLKTLIFFHLPLKTCPLVQVVKRWEKNQKLYNYPSSMYNPLYSNALSHPSLLDQYALLEDCSGILRSSVFTCSHLNASTSSKQLPLMTSLSLKKREKLHTFFDARERFCPLVHRNCHVREQYWPAHLQRGLVVFVLFSAWE